MQQEEGRYHYKFGKEVLARSSHNTAESSSTHICTQNGEGIIYKDTRWVRIGNEWRIGSGVSIFVCVYQYDLDLSDVYFIKSRETVGGRAHPSFSGLPTPQATEDEYNRGSKVSILATS